MILGFFRWNYSHVRATTIENKFHVLFASRAHVSARPSHPIHLCTTSLETLEPQVHDAHLAATSGLTLTSG